MSELNLSKDLTQFVDCCSEHLSVFSKRNRQYGGAFRETGVLGSVVEITGIAARFKQLVIRNPQHGRDKKEQILNACEDLHNYANFVRMMVLEENWEGLDLDEAQEDN